MKCPVCGRKLRSYKSQEVGYGPVCYKKKFGSFPCASRRGKNTSSQAREKDHNLPGQISIDEYLRVFLGE